jgi:hypothetical protein
MFQHQVRFYANISSINFIYIYTSSQSLSIFAHVLTSRVRHRTHCMVTSFYSRMHLSSPAFLSSTLHLKTNSLLLQEMTPPPPCGQLWHPSQHLVHVGSRDVRHDTTSSVPGWIVQFPKAEACERHASLPLYHSTCVPRRENWPCHAGSNCAHLTGWRLTLVQRRSE